MGAAFGPLPAAGYAETAGLFMLAVNRALTALAIFTALGGAGLGAPALAHDPSLHLFERTPEFDYDPPQPGTYALPALGSAADGDVLEANGARRRLGDIFKGKIVLLSLIYTLCGDAKGCPLATSTLHDIFNASAHDSELARDLRIVSLSFDPERDVPEALAAYAAPIKAAPNAVRKSEWVFATTESETKLAPILAGYDQVVSKSAGPDKAFDGALDHTLHVYLIDRAGQLRNIYTLAFLDPRLLIADVKTLLMEERGTAQE